MTRAGVRLASHDFGGDGLSVLLLHGLAGHADEWAQTASWLTARCRVVALDARGHGRSERFPGDVSRDAQVSDAAFVVEQLSLQPVVVVGQSIGGLTALSLAARRPELVRGVVLVDASPPSGGEGVEEAVNATAGALREWPASFDSRSEAEAFFAERFGAGLAAEAWASGLDLVGNRWQPRFDVEVMAQTLREAIAVPSWEEWDSIMCPALVVRAGNGMVEPETAKEMTERLPMAQLVEIDDAGHDLHLDRPDEWRGALTCFLDSIDGLHGSTLDGAAEEEPLDGGNTHAEVVRVGGTVRRPVGRWTPGVHALLRHLETRGFDGAPRVVGLDSQGRESLTFVPGTVVWPDHFDLVASDSALAGVATLIRTYHRTVGDFLAPNHFEWSDRGRDPSGRREILCHNDLAPWNLILRSDDGWAFIDWDTAAPGRLAWDLSWALMSFVPLWPDSNLGADETLHRISIFADAYGHSDVPDDVIAVAVERCRHEADSIERRGAAGEAPYATLLADGHAAAWHRTGRHIDTHMADWICALRDA